MPDSTNKEAKPIPKVTIPGLGAVPVVAVKLPDGTIALRHPSEIQKLQPPPAAKGGGQ